MRKKQREILSPTVTVSAVHATVTAIDILPNDALFQIFDFCRVGHNPLESPFHPVWQWQRLIHVCRRWRLIIFSSPRRLDLCLRCKLGTPVRKNLDLWPAFPIIVDYINSPRHTSKISPNDDDNVIAALEHPDRVRCLKLPVTSSLLEKVATVAREPFPTLAQLWLSSKGGNVSVLPSEFLGGTAPRLRSFHLDGIAFLTLPTLLSSAFDLVDLSLHRIPQAGYISPEVMVASLAALTRLDFLSIGFQSSTSHPDGFDECLTATLAPIPTRVVLSALTLFEFRGASEYLEDLVARIDAPCLASIQIKYFNQLIFEVPQLFKFIRRTQIIEQALDALVYLLPSYIYLVLLAGPADNRRISLYLHILCQGLDWQVSHLAEVLSQSSAVLPNVHHLSIFDFPSPRLKDEMDDTEWLALFRQFTAVQTLRVFGQQTGHVAHALNNVTVEMVPEILPALRLLFLEYETAGGVEKFITAHLLAGLPPVATANTLQEYFSGRSVPPFKGRRTSYLRSYRPPLT
jgi:hypothetical protein